MHVDPWGASRMDQQRSVTPLVKGVAITVGLMYCMCVLILSMNETLDSFLCPAKCLTTTFSISA